MERRGARPVMWPAKLLWVPLLMGGILLMAQPDVQTDTVSDGGWRVVSTMSTPDIWVQSPATFYPGLVLTLIGITAAFAYSADLRIRGLTATEYPWFTAAAWIFTILALMAWFRTTGHVAEIGTTGVDWRFLAYMRSEILDYILFGVAATAAVLSWAASWGRPD